MELWLLIIGALLMLWYFKTYRFTVGTLNGFVGGNGTGKSFCGTWLAVKTFYRQWTGALMDNVGILFKNLFRRKHKKKPLKEMPVLAANIPMRIPLFGSAYQLSEDHLLLREKLPEGSVIVIDEHGQFCSQFGFNNPNATNNGAYDEFLRLCRHYGNFKVFIMEQCSGNIIFSCRRRLQTLNNMLSIRFLPILPIFIARVRTLSVSEEIKTVESGMDGQTSRLVIGIRPLKPLYDTRAFSERYATVPAFRGRRYPKGVLKTNKVIVCPSKRVQPLTTDEDVA